MHPDRESPIKLHSRQWTREENCKRIFDLINSEGTLTRAELARITALSPSTVSSLVDDLLRAKLIEEAGLARMASGAGRRPVMLHVNPAGRQLPVFSISRWGVNFKLFDLGYNVLEECFCPCPCGRPSPDGSRLSLDEDDGSGAAYSRTIVDMLSRSSRLDAARVASVLISYPGIYLEQDRRFILTSVQTSFSRDVIDALERRLGLPIYMGNSSMSYAYAEKKHRDRHASGIDDLIYINVCDGLGAGIILNGEMLMRSGRIAGEVGHITVEIGGRPCPCGNAGCLERYVNLNAIVEAVQSAVMLDHSGAHSDHIRALLENPTLELIGRAYDDGVESVRSALDDVAEKLFAGIYSMVNVTGIQSVVIGGGVERIGDCFLRKLRSFMEGRRGQMWMREMSIMYPQTGALADCVGLAQYFMDLEFNIAAGQ